MTTAWLLVALLVAVTLGVLAWMGITVLREYERGVVFRAGRLRPLYEPGVKFLIPLVDRIERVDLRKV